MADLAPLLLWFRRDLRLADNPALAAAAASGRPILPVFVLDDVAPGSWAEGGATRWWLHHSLTRLDESLQRTGVTLQFRRGDATTVIPAMAAEIGAAAVYCNRVEEPWALGHQRLIEARLQADGRRLVAGTSALLFDQGAITTQSGQPFRVFSPFWRACLAHDPPALPLDAPESLNGFAAPPSSLSEFGLLPRHPDWAGGLRATWIPGEAQAQLVLKSFLQGGISGYGGHRDRPDLPGTSRLSPHLRFGEISPRQIFHAVQAQVAPGYDPDKYLAELGWREFSYHLLAQAPSLPDAPFRPEFARFPWREDPTLLRAWQRGQTGYPIIDAGMRQLWNTGWMHNRVRMVVASFLVKNLLQPWQAGAAWFWDTLVDADLASNSAGWQWAAGCGADAAPFFRIFNPLLQAEKFDPNGDYVRRWCPELAKLPTKWLHRPFEAPSDILRKANVHISRGYPAPLVDLKATRDRALAAFKTLGQDA